MIPKTPNFNKALDEILKNLKSQKRTCQQCKNKFDIFKEDIEFYKMLQVPPPKLCPDCRKQRGMAWINYNRLHKRKCDAPGHKESTISLYRNNTFFKVYDFKYWWSDKWDPMDYKREYQSNKNCFEQIFELLKEVPLINSTRDPGNVDSDYVTAGREFKNCYFVMGGLRAENIMYSHWPLYSKDSIDITVLVKSELCYEVIDAISCYDCKFIIDCHNCIDSSFLYDCRHCNHCFGCANLRHKSYCFFNKQLSKKEYQKRIKGINLGNRDILDKYKARFQKILKNCVHQNIKSTKAENSLGSTLEECKDCYMCFTVYVSENIRYADLSESIKDSMDIVLGARNTSLSYTSLMITDVSGAKFSYFLRGGLNLEYCLECHNCQYCFGCIGLRNKSYCIFNKQYSKAGYYKLLDKIKTKMLSDGEYGEFFPYSMSLYPYNDTYAMIEFPLTKEQVLKNGWQWRDEPKISTDLKGLNLIKIKDIPKDIKDVKDDILDKAIICEITGRPFRIIKTELDFYRKHNLPIPTKHPYQRMSERFQKRNPAKLWKAKCSKCHKQIFTSYPPAKQKELKIYCKNCYNKEVG